MIEMEAWEEVMGLELEVNTTQMASEIPSLNITQ